MYMWEAEEKLNELAKENGIDCTIINDRNHYKPMSYRPRDNELRFNLGQILGVSGRFGYMFKDTFYCIAYHEFGHYKDFTDNPTLIDVLEEAKSQDTQIYKRLIYDCEYQAMILGRQFIKDARLLEQYDILNQKRLDSMKQIK